MSSVAVVIPVASEANLRELGASSIEEIIKRDTFMGILSLSSKRIAFGQRGLSGHEGHPHLREKYHFVEGVFQFAYGDDPDGRPLLQLLAKLERGEDDYSASSPEDLRIFCNVFRALGLPADTLVHWFNEPHCKGPQ